MNETPTQTCERSDISEELRWDLTPVYADWDAWERDFAAVEADLDAIEALRGAPARSGAELLRAVETLLAVQRRLDVVSVYASMRGDEDMRLGENVERRGRVSSLSVRFGEASSWFEPEVLELDDAALAAHVAAEPALGLYAHYFDDLRRSRPHVLPVEQEALLASAGMMARGASAVFGALDNADLSFGTVRDEDGTVVELTKARYSRLVRSCDRRVRREAFEVFMDAYAGFNNTLAANQDANVRNHVFFARARRHAGTLEAALHDNAVPVSVYHALVGTVRGRLPELHRYTALRRRVLGLDELHEYDLHVPLFADGEFSFTYEESRTLLLEALAPLGGDYLAVVERAFAERWIDVHENAGKRSGAYSGGAYDTAPYMLLNWSGQLRDTFTLAHEMGHSVHTWLAARNQPYVYGDYPIFTAEVASTFNEQLLLHHLLAKETDPRRRLFLLDTHLEQINGTVFRQTMFADFEHRMHRQVEEGGTLTAERLGETYLEALHDFWGPEVAFDPVRSPLSWSRIPHFYYKYYVYQYATAFAASVALSRRVLGGGATELDAYLGFQRSGCSRYPVDTLRAAGVDMETPGPVDDVFALFNGLIDEIEALLETEAGS